MKKLFASALALFLTAAVSGPALAAVSPTGTTAPGKHHHVSHKGVRRAVPGKSTIKN